VVRIVLELESLKDYELEYADEAIRISIGADRSFAAWSSAIVGENPRDDSRYASYAPPPGPPQQPTVEASYDSASVTEVMEGFAAISGRTIVLGRDVTGYVTARIRNQPWDVAFQAILDAQGLSADEDEHGIIRVDTRQALAARDSLEPLNTHVMRLNYARAASLLPVLDGSKSERGTVVADTATNSIVVTDVPHRLEALQSLVSGLDIPTPQVSIQAKIIAVSRTDVLDLGIQYDWGDQNSFAGTFFNTVLPRPDPSKGQDSNGDGINDVFQQYDPNEVAAVVELGGDVIAGVANADAGLPATALDLLFSVAIDRFSFSAWIQALQSMQLADEQAEPLITTADNQEAEILVGDQTPIRVVDAGAAGPGASRVELIETGIKLNVTPHVTANGQVLLDVLAEASSFQEVDTDLGFTFNTRRATSQVLVEDGQTAVIGGLTQTTVTLTKSGIPFLVDLPILGTLFGTTREREERKDLLILVTPHILETPAIGGN
jgi:type IV pilus assembly protein PilQ